jgi:hypothetical protein
VQSGLRGSRPGMKSSRYSVGYAVARVLLRAHNEDTNGTLRTDPAGLLVAPQAVARIERERRADHFEQNMRRVTAVSSSGCPSSFRGRN